VVQVGEGSDHLSYEVNGELIVRCSKEPDPADRAEHVDREAARAVHPQIAPTPFRQARDWCRLRLATGPSIQPQASVTDP
jgi:hypothetical protein